MFVFTISDIIYGVIILIVIILSLSKFIKNRYLKYKYKKCQKCGGETGSYTDIRHSFLQGKVVSCEVYMCKKCDWKEKVYD